MGKEVTPRILHQTWKTTEIPSNLRGFVQSCKAMNSDYEYHLWTDQDLYQFIHRFFPQYAAAYDNFAQNIERVDFARYAIMYQIGGVYADLDIQCVKPFDSLLVRNQPIFGDEPVEHRERLYNNRKHVICNALLISPPRNSLWLKIMDFIVRTYHPTHGPVYNTGPMALTRMYEQTPRAFDGALITNPCIFYAQSDHMTNNTQDGVPFISRECDLADAITIHRWAHTWVQSSRASDGRDARMIRPWMVLSILAVILCLIMALSHWK